MYEFSYTRITSPWHARARATAAPPRPRETRGTVRHTSTQSGTTAGAPIAPAAVAHVAVRSPHTRSSPASRMHRRERFRAQRSRPVTAPTPRRPPRTHIRRHGTVRTHTNSGRLRPRRVRGRSRRAPLAITPAEDRTPRGFSSMQGSHTSACWHVLQGVMGREPLEGSGSGGTWF